jgi:hypothetical protein
MSLAQIEALLLPLAIALLEGVWLGLWLTWLGRLPALAPQAGGPLLPFWVIVATVLGGHWLGRFALADGARRRAASADLARARRLAALGGLAAVVLGTWSVYGMGHAPWSPAWLGRFLTGLATNWTPVSAQGLSLAAAVYLWRRGILSGQAAAQEAHDDLRRTFYVGVAGLGLVILLAARPSAQGARLLPGEVGGGVLVYFATGLGALALTSASRALRSSQVPGQPGPALSRYWIGAAAGVIALVLAGATAAGWLVTPEPIRAIFTALTPVVRFGSGALLFVFILVAYVALIAAAVLAPLLRDLLINLARLPLPQLAPSEPPRFDQLAQQINRLIDSVPAARLILNLLAVALLLDGIALIFWLALNRLAQRRSAGVEETREGIASRELFGQQMASLLRRLWPRRRPPSTYLRLHGPTGDSRLIVRRAYQTMLAWAAEALQEPRQPAQTPVAYAERLGRRLPEASEPVGRLTRAYLKARYAAAAPTPVEAEEARQAAARLRQLNADRPPALPALPR